MNALHSACRGYEKKLYNNRLVPEGKAIFGITTGNYQWSRQSSRIKVLSQLADRLQTDTLLFARPAEPYNTIVEYLADNTTDVICPDDSETRTFLVDLPVIDQFSADAMAQALLNRKCVVVRGHGIVVSGKTGAREAYTNFAAAGFACFVKFFSDYLTDVRRGVRDENSRLVFNQAVKHLPPPPVFGYNLATGPFDTSKKAFAAIIEAGNRMVSLGLVDACFGNLSYRIDDMIYISKTGSFLDALDGDIAVCSTTDPKCTGQKPSSEFPAHLRIMDDTETRGILHGHPLFSVIMSMDCTVDCDHSGACHRTCPHQRYTSNIPIVPGEVGDGPYGLYTTVPRVIKKNQSAIVYGHGVFTTTQTDFNEAMGRMVDIERACREEYFNQTGQNR